MDEAECLRVGGRLRKAPIPEETRPSLVLDPEARDNASNCNAQSPPFVLYKQQARFERAETEVLDPERAGRGSKDSVKSSVLW